MPSQEDEIRALQKARSESKGTALGAAASSEFDRDLYGGAKGLSREIVDEPSQDDGETGGLHPSTQRDLRGPADDDDGEDPFKAHRDRNPANIPIAERESAYQAKGRATRELSPERQDPFADATPARGFREAMGSNVVDRERDDLLKKIAEKDDDDKQGKKRRFDDAGDKPAKEGKFDGTPGRFDATPGRFDATPGRFDATPGRFDATPGRFDATPGRFDATPGRFNATPGRFDATPGRFQATPGRFDATPGRFEATPGRFDATPGRFESTPGRFEATPGRFEATPSRFDATPGRGVAAASRWEATPARDAVPQAQQKQRWDATPLQPAAPATKRSRWDETPVAGDSAQTPVGLGGATPAGLIGAETPTPTAFAAQSAAALAMDRGPVTPEMAQRMRWEREMNERNRYLTDEELDSLFPSTGYRILEPPAGYAPIATPSRKLTATPTPLGQSALGVGGFKIQETPSRDQYGIPGLNVSAAANAELPDIKPEDYQYFAKLMEDVDEDGLTRDEAVDLKIMRLLLKIKNGTPPQRKTALRQITEKAREFGAGPLFNQILPLLMSPTLEDQERHLLVKVIDRILYKLDDLVRPFVHKILVVIEPLLIDEDYYARVEGREDRAQGQRRAGGDQPLGAVGEQERHARVGADPALAHGVRGARDLGAEVAKAQLAQDASALRLDQEHVAAHAKGPLVEGLGQRAQAREVEVAGGGSAGSHVNVARRP